MIKFILYKNQNERNTAAYGLYYPRIVIEDTMDLRALCRHMSEHNSGYSEAQCLGVITAMRKCIKEQILEGKNVKIDDLCIFSCGLQTAGGAESEETFTVKGNISGVKLRCRASGELSNTNLTTEATLKRVSAVTVKRRRKSQDEATPTSQSAAKSETKGAKV